VLLAETRRLALDDDGWVHRKPDPADDDGDREFLGSIEDPDCVTDDLADEFESLCCEWRREVGALQRDVDDHNERRWAR
jgi:hypothetical protein